MTDYYARLLLLSILKKEKKTFKLTVSGTSMLPILQPGEIIQVCAKDTYVVGNILVFVYKKKSLLVHRLLKIEGGRYFCKGDNSFRLEDIEKSNIIGAVILESDRNSSAEFISASYAIHKVFQKNGYDLLATKTSIEYLEYQKKYLEKRTKT